MSEVVFSPVASERQGFFIIPGFSKYLIDENSNIVDRELGSSVKPIKGQYLRAWLFSDADNRMTDPLIHHLVARTFHGPQPDDKPIVNHKDGNKHNNYFDNIEWASYSWNIDHAYRNGLRTDNTPVLLKDLRTGEIRRFHASAECARYLQCSAPALCKYLNRPSRAPISNFFVVKYEDDDSPWPPFTAEDVDKSFNGFAKDAAAYDLEKSLVIVAESINVLGRLLGIGGGTISYAIRTGRQYPVKGYLFKLVTDPTPWNIPDNTADLNDRVQQTA